MPTRTPRNVAERVASTLRRAIVRGRLQPGSSLPSERALAARYAVNRSSIREAMKRLEAWGLVKIRQGEATRVSEYLTEIGLEMLPSLVAAGGALGDSVMRDVHEIRGLLLGFCAEKAAIKADAASMLRLEELARQMSEPKVKPSERQVLDYDFFEQLVLISGNQLLLLFSKVVREVYFHSAGRFLAIYASDVFEPAHHRQAVAAIRRRDAGAAKQAMQAHAASGLVLLERRAS